MRKLYLILMIIFASSTLTISTIAQDDALDLTETVQFYGIDFLIDYPEGWVVRTSDPRHVTWIEETRNDAQNQNYGWLVNGIVISLDYVEVAFIESIGGVIEDGIPEELITFNEGFFGWEMSNIEVVQIFGVDALVAEAQDSSGAHLAYHGFLDEENVFLLDINAPDEEALAEFLPIWEEMLATIREGTIEVGELVPTIDSVPDDITLFSSYDELTQYIDDIESSSGDEAITLVDALWDELISTNNIPLIIGDVVVFFYRGDDESINWVGDFNQYAPNVNNGLGEQVGDTDLWLSKTVVPLDALLLYVLLIDNSNFILDPANPNMCGCYWFGESLLAMPEFESTTFSDARDGIDTGMVSETLVFDSENMGYSINYQVYTPAGYDSLSNLPSIYLLDGGGFADLSAGAYPTILDNMIADGLIEPVIAVFVSTDDRRTNEYVENPDFARFIAEELVSAVDAEFMTDTNASSRVIKGASFGGIAAGYIAVQHPDVFENMALSSPSFWSSHVLLDLFEANDDVPFNIFMNWGIPEWDNGDLTSTAEELADLGFNIETMQVMEGRNFQHWRDVSDETLIFFFGTD